MSRPQSAASSAASASLHKRQPSVKTAGKPSGTSATSLFVTNLRLLDLDLQPDWPQITAQSFGNQDARNRTKCAEYALYQLFRLYDPATTTDKLQPFFPPLEPLQSVNLRAALYRCLNDLKKNGVLAREYVLRKTMLDECQGDRFWEVCLAFSAIVLRKQMSEKNKKKANMSISYRLASASVISRSEKESMLPLAIAHKAALSRVLREKQKKWETYARLYDVLAQKETELQERKVKSQKSLPVAANQERLREVEQTVEQSWLGDNDLRDALIGGDVCASGDEMLLRSFDDLWKTNGNDSNVGLAGPDVAKGFIQTLQENVEEQSQRLKKWQNFHEKVVASKPRSTQSSSRNSTSVKPVVRFDRHRDLTIRDAAPVRDREASRQHQRHDSVLRYDEILTAMRDELRRNVANPGAVSPVKQSIPPMRRAQTQPLSVSKRTSLILEPPVNANGNHHHQRSPSQTAVPMRLGTRTPSRSRSYQQPKVISQREPIPFKSELFSPLKDRRRSSAGSGSLLASPPEDREVCSPQTDTSYDLRAETSHSGSLTNSGIGNGLGITSIGALSNMHTSATLLPTDEIPSADSPTPQRYRGVDAQAMPAPQASGHIHGVTLAERTRMSMAFNPSTSNADSEPAVITSPMASPRPVSMSASENMPPPPIKAISLAERTRQSIALAPQPRAGASLPPPAVTSSSPALPIPTPTFETPKKRAHQPRDSHQPSSPSASEYEDESGALDGQISQANSIAPAAGTSAVSSTIGHRDITPLDQLLSPEAEYAAVFKSRPRIVHSPRGSLRMEGEGLV